MKNSAISDLSLKSISQEKVTSVQRCQKAEIQEINFSLDIFEVLSEGVFIFIDNKIIFVNPAGLEIFGVQQQKDIIGKNPVDIFSPQSYIKIEKLHNSILKGDINRGKIKNIIVYTPGLSKILNFTSSIIDYHNKPAIISVFNEVSTSDEKSDRIKEQDNIYRIIFETTGTVIFLLEENSIISMVNGACKKISGYTREEIEGKMTWMDLVSNDDIHRMEQFHDGRRNSSKGIPKSYGFKLKRKNGEYRNVFVTVSMVSGTKRSVATIMDVTDIRRAEKTIAESEEKYRLLAENARDIFIVHDLNGKIHYVNRGGCEAIGLPMERIRGRDIGSLFPSYKDPRTFKAVIERKVSDDTMFIHKTDFKKPSGESVRFEIHATIVTLEDERRSILFIARDITERKRLEQEMHEMHERVRQQVGQDLHDDLGPHLIGIEALTEVVKHKLEHKNAPETEEVEKIRMLINRAIMKTQRLMRGLCPVDLDSKGLLSAITNVTVIVSNIWKVSCRFHYDHSIAVEDNAIATNLYYIVKEAAYNAARHSGAKNIIINLKHRKSGLVIEVVDDGSGITVAARKHPGMGLRIMRYRAELINGTFVIRRNKPAGTLVLCTVPGI